MVGTLERSARKRGSEVAVRPDDRPLRWAICGTLAFGIAFILRSSTVVGGERTFTLFDDAMVSMRYAHNLARGNGLVWNAGQQGVEGYTNFAWTLWMAALHLTGLPLRLIGLLVSLTGLGLLVANLVVVAKLCRELAPGRPDAERTALLLTTTAYSLVFWTLRGMEVGLVALVLSAAAFFAIRSVRGQRSALVGLALVGIVGVLTRTDVAVPLAVVVAYVLWHAPAATRRAALLAPAAIVGALAVHTALRLRWYGEALPNTYALKLGGISLGDRLHRGAAVAALLAFVELAVPVALAVFALVSRRPAAMTELRMLCAVAGACLAYAVYVGGDAWEWMRVPDRYVAPALPLLFIVCGVAVDALRRRGVMGLAAVLAVGAVIAQAAPFPRSLLQLDDRSTRLFVAPMIVATVALLALVAAKQVNRAAIAIVVAGALVAPALGRWVDSAGDHVSGDILAAKLADAVDASTAADATVAVTWAGSLPYFSDRRAIDLLGKSDPVIARSEAHDVPLYPGHMRWDYGYSIGKLRPDLIVTVWSVTPADLEDFARWGYVQVDHDGDVWVRTDSTKVDVEGLRTRVTALGI